MPQRALTAEATDWGMIAALYDALGEVAPSPIVELNRGVAVAMAYGPAEGLAIVDLRSPTALPDYHLLPSVRGDLLAKLGRLTRGPAGELERAAAMTRNARERALLLARAAACGSIPPVARRA